MIPRSFILAALLALPGVVRAESRAWHWSAAAAIAASTADAATSWGRFERNPLLRGPDGRFRHRGVCVKLSVTGGWLLAQRALLRRRPKAMRYGTAVNYGVAVGFAGVAAYNIK